MLASGYLKVLRTEYIERTGRTEYYLALTNKETRLMFETMIQEWFSQGEGTYNVFLKAFLQDDLKAMNVYMNQVALASFSYFDTGKGVCGRCAGTVLPWLCAWPDGRTWGSLRADFQSRERTGTL